MGYPSGFYAHLFVDLIEAGLEVAAGRGGSAPHENMRLIQSGVPDVHSPEFAAAFAAEARRPSRLVAQSPEEAEIQAFNDAVHDRFEAPLSIAVFPLTNEPISAPILRTPVQPTPENGLHTCHLMVDNVTTLPCGTLGHRIGLLADSELPRLNTTLLVFPGLAR
ncbi:MAG: antitoxin MazE-like protein [Cyanobacteriota bacterium]